MKFSKETIDILKNYAALNQSILFRPGNKIKASTHQKNVIATAIIAETIPQEFAIYDLNQLLGTMSLFEDPEITIGEKSLQISDANGSIANYIYASKDAIVAAPEKEINFPTPEVDFTLDEKTYSSALRAASVMNLPHVAFEGRNGGVFISAVNSVNASEHTWMRKIGDTEHKFRVIFRTELLKLLPRDYAVSISSKKIARFVSKKGDVTYFAAPETDSTFGV